MTALGLGGLSYRSEPVNGLLDRSESVLLPTGPFSCVAPCSRFSILFSATYRMANWLRIRTMIIQEGTRYLVQLEVASNF